MAVLVGVLLLQADVGASLVPLPHIHRALRRDTPEIQRRVAAHLIHRSQAPIIGETLHESKFTAYDRAGLLVKRLSSYNMKQKLKCAVDMGRSPA